MDLPNGHDAAMEFASIPVSSSTLKESFYQHHVNLFPVGEEPTQQNPRNLRVHHLLEHLKQHQMEKNRSNK
jgi:hypothetical protein